MKNFIKHFFIATLVTFCLTIFSLFFLQKNTELSFYRSLISFGYTALFTFPFYFFNSYTHKAATNYQKKIATNPKIYWILYTVFIIFCNVFLAFALTNIQSLLSGGTLEFKTSYFYGTVLISLTIGFFFYALFYINAAFQKKTKEQAKNLAVVKQNHAALQAQIEPHFLFNSLNVLSGLIDENPEKAQEFIADLAQVYRYVLEQNNKEWVSLADEMKFAHNYLTLLKTRFEDGLQLSIDPTLENSTEKIAALTLQLLIENCVKHNTASSYKPLFVHLYRNKTHLIIENSLHPKNQISKSPKTGLNNIKIRYQSIDKQIQIKQTEDKFTVWIPLIEEEI